MLGGSIDFKDLSWQIYILDHRSWHFKHRRNTNQLFISLGEKLPYSEELLVGSFCSSIKFHI